MVSYSVKLDSRTKQHTQFGVSAGRFSVALYATEERGEKQTNNID